jgi:hypothetical protein
MNPQSSKGQTAEQRLRPRSYCDRFVKIVVLIKTEIMYYQVVVCVRTVFKERLVKCKKQERQGRGVRNCSKIIIIRRRKEGEEGENLR